MAITSFYISDLSLADRKTKSWNALFRLKVLFNKILLKKYKQTLLTSTRTRHMKSMVNFTLQTTTICENVTDRWKNNCDHFLHNFWGCPEDSLHLQKVFLQKTLYIHLFQTDYNGWQTLLGQHTYWHTGTHSGKTDLADERHSKL